MPLEAILKPIERVLRFLAGVVAKSGFLALLGLFSGQETAFRSGGVPKGKRIAKKRNFFRAWLFEKSGL
jgi:hypothetical protein